MQIVAANNDRLTSHVIKVDRAVKATQYGFLKPGVNCRLAHPRIENAGPAEYDLAKLEHWYHAKQIIRGYATAAEIYRELEKKGLILFCLGLRDGEEILNHSDAFVKLFRTQWGTPSWILWKSVVLETGPGRNYVWVPFLRIHGCNHLYVTLDWMAIYDFGGLSQEDTTLCYPDYAI